MNLSLNLFYLFFLFFLFAFFSASEIALFSIDKRLLKKNLGENPWIYKYLLFLVDSPKRLLVTLLIGSTLISTGISMLAVVITEGISLKSSLNRNILFTIQIATLTILTLLFAELIPKVFASKHPLKIAKFVSIPFYWISVMMYPFAQTLTEIINLTISKIKFDKKKNAFNPEEINELAVLGQEKGAIIEKEQGLIQSIISFKSVAVYEAMTPRVDMISISKNESFQGAIKIITDSGHSRIPVYDEDLDQIIGILYAKDILPFINNKQVIANLKLEEIARDAYFVPKTKMINKLMREFLEKKMHIAIVVDEYGGTAGLISLEDILEEIIGEIRDEYDKEEPAIIKVNDYSWMVLGKFNINELNEMMDSPIISENSDYETVGGLVLSSAGSIPKEGYSFTINNFKFTVKEVFKKRINKVLIEKLMVE